MAFNWLGTFRVGSYMVFRRFVAHELRDVGARLKVIHAEIARIGFVSIAWKPSDVEGDPLVLNIDEDEEDETVPVTKVDETRIGLVISGPGTTVAKLMRAYTAAGGNPFDISMFLDPQEGISVAADPDAPDGFRITWTHPGGGVAYPRTREDVGGGSFTDVGGTLSINKSLELRVGEVLDWSKAELNAGYIRKARDWISQEIREKRNDLEWRILKQMDLREQLRSEAGHLIARAAGGFGQVPHQPDEHATDLSVPAILWHFDSIFFERKDGIPQVGYRYEQPDNEGRSPPNFDEGRVINAQNLAPQHYGPLLYDDDDPDAWTGL
jgi:hypothetical protein